MALYVVHQVIYIYSKRIAILANLGLDLDRYIQRQRFDDHRLIRGGPTIDFFAKKFIYIVYNIYIH